ncbi:MAG TPA: hypothetical protein VI756_14460 [Blastocatellia bacterium]
MKFGYFLASDAYIRKDLQYVSFALNGLAKDFARETGILLFPCDGIGDQRKLRTAFPIEGCVGNDNYFV